MADSPVSFSEDDIQQPVTFGEEDIAKPQAAAPAPAFDPQLERIAAHPPVAKPEEPGLFRRALGGFNMPPEEKAKQAANISEGLKESYSGMAEAPVAASGIKGYPKMAGAVKKYAGTFNPANYGTEGDASRARTQSGADLIEGATEAATPLMAAGAIAAPLRTALGIGTGMAASWGAGKVAKGAGGSQETQELAKDVAFFLPSVLGAVSGFKSAKIPENPAGVTGTQAEAFGGRVKGAVVQTPQGAGAGVKVGGTSIAVGKVNDVVAAMSKARLVEGEAAKTVRGVPPEPPPPPPGPEQVTPKHVDAIAQVIQGLPEEQRGPATLEAHENLAKWIAARGRVVGPDGKIYTAKNPEQASSVAGKWINDAVTQVDRQAAEATKEAEKAASQSPQDRARKTPGKASAVPQSTTPSVPSAQPPLYPQQPDIVAPGGTDNPQPITAQPPATPPTPNELAQVGTKDSESGRQVLQPKETVAANQKLAVQAAPELHDALAQIAGSIPGAQFERLRPQKSTDRAGEKVEEENKPPETVPDYLAAQVAADTPQAKDQLVAELKRNFNVLEVEDKFLEGRPDKAGYPSTNVQVQLGNGSTAEVQIVPREVQNVSLDTHKLYSKGREAEIAGNNKERDRWWGEAEKINKAKLGEFKARNGIQEQQPTVFSESEISSEAKPQLLEAQPQRHSQAPDVREGQQESPARPAESRTPPHPGPDVASSSPANLSKGQRVLLKDGSEGKIGFVHPEGMNIVRVKPANGKGQLYAKREELTPIHEFSEEEIRPAEQVVAEAKERYNKEFGEWRKAHPDADYRTSDEMAHTLSERILSPAYKYEVDQTVRGGWKGLTAKEPIPSEKKYDHGSTQTDIPENSEASRALDVARKQIADSDLAGKGKDVGGNHVTVRYGLDGDQDKVRAFLERQKPFEAKLGKTSKFPPTENSDGAAVIIAPIESPELHRLNAEIEKHGQFAESSFPEYKPHATLAYVKPEAAEKYVGMGETAGKSFTVDSIAITDRDGKQEVVKLGQQRKLPISEAAKAHFWDQVKGKPGGHAAASAPADKARIAIKEAGMEDMNAKKGVPAEEYAKYMPGNEPAHTFNAPGLGTTFTRPASELQSAADVLKIVKAKFAEEGKDLPAELQAKLEALTPSAANTVIGKPGASEVTSHEREPKSTAGPQSREVQGAQPAREGQPAGNLPRHEEERLAGGAGGGEAAPKKFHVEQSDDIDALKRRLAELEAAVGGKPPRRDTSSFRKAAESLESQIEQKRNPAISNQNVTARRARIADGMSRDADRLERIKRKLVAIADATDQGSLPESLSGVRNRAQVEALLSNNPLMPRPGAHKSTIQDALKETLHLSGAKEARSILGRTLARGEAFIHLYGDEEINAFDTLRKKAEDRGVKTTYWNTHGLDDYKRLRAAGIDTHEKYTQARKDLAELGGEAKPENSKESQIKAAERGLIGTKIPGYFPTPRPLAERLVKEADIQPGMSVLEPSAGKGNIADAIKAEAPGAKIDTVEPSTQLRDILNLKGHNVVGNDFLSHSGQYDRIVMNPPFENGQDIEHVRRAYDMLKPGGRVVAIMSEGPFFRNDKKAVGFREWLDDAGGISEKLPEGSFTGKDAERQTGVASRMVTIDKPEASKGQVVRTADPEGQLLDDIRDRVMQDTEAKDKLRTALQQHEHLHIAEPTDNTLRWYTDTIATHFADGEPVGFDKDTVKAVLRNIPLDDLERLRELRNPGEGSVAELYARGNQDEERRPAELPHSNLPPGGTGEIPTGLIKQSPHRFQYKLNTDAEGVGQLLKEQTKYNPDLAGVITVWRDPEDGRLYVVNGHHRLELAKRTGAPTVIVRHVVAKDAAEARSIGALQNIAEGRGTPIDAAKFLRDTNTTPEKLRAEGISMGESTASKGVALAKLDDSIFGKVVQGDFPIERAVAIGEATDDHGEQRAIADLIDRQERKGKKVSNDTLRELVRFVKGAGQSEETTASLFGAETVQKSHALEKAEVSAYIKQQLAKDKKLFGFVSKGERAEELERGNNIIDVKTSKALAEEATQGEEVYNKLSERAGPISDILDDAAARLAGGENANAVKQEAYADIKSELAQTLGGSAGPRAQEREGAARREFSLGGQEETAGYRQRQPNSELSDSQLSSWSKSRSLRISDGGKQNSLFGGDEPMYKLTRLDSDGQPEHTLVSQAQFDSLRKGFPNFDKAARAFEKGVEPAGVQTSMFEAGKQASAASRNDTSGNLFGNERGAARPEALNPVFFITEAAKRLNSAYDNLVERGIQRANLGRSFPDVERVDERFAELVRELKAAPQYFKAKAEAIDKEIVGGLSREQEKGFVLLADKASREWLAEHKNAEYQRYYNDPAIQKALSKYKPAEEELRDAQKALGGVVIEDDYLRRVYDKHVAGVGEGGKAEQSYPKFDRVITPQMANSKGRKVGPDYYYSFGLHEFGPSFVSRYVATHLKLAEHNLAVNFMSNATKLTGKDALPSFIDYNGDRYYSPEAARLIRESQPDSEEGKQIAKELGIEQLPKPSEAKEYGIYSPEQGSKFEGRAKSLANSVIAGDEQAAGKAQGLLASLGTRYLGPKEVVKTLENNADNAVPAFVRDLSAVMDPITGALRQNILVTGIPHIKNILRATMLARPTGQLDPRAWVDAWKVAFDKELKARALRGVNDEAFDALLKHAGMSPHGGIEYKHYLNLNLDKDAWRKFFNLIPALRQAYGEPGLKGVAKGTSRVAGELLSLPAHSVNAAMRSTIGTDWHKLMFGDGGLDQKARIQFYDRVRAEDPDISDAEIADRVNDFFGRYARAGWTVLQKVLAPFMLFPGWSFRSINFALRYPIRSVLPAAVITALVNYVVNRHGRKKDKYDTRRLHIGGRSVSETLLNERMAEDNPLTQLPIDYATSRLRGKTKGEAVGDALSGLSGDAGALIGTANPLVTMLPEVGFNKQYPGSQDDIYKKADFHKKGAVVPKAAGGKGTEDWLKYAMRKSLPQVDNSGALTGKVDPLSFAGRNVGTSNYPEKRKRY